MGALDHIVRSGRALYVGISSYSAEDTRKAAAILCSMGTPCLIHQPSYNLFYCWVEDGLLETLEAESMGCVVFSPLAQGLLTSKYLKGVPEGSRASKAHGFLKPKDITIKKLDKIRRLDKRASKRGQTLAQLALAWVLRHPVVTSALIGASRVEQIDDAVAALANLAFSAKELSAIETILGG